MHQLDIFLADVASCTNDVLIQVVLTLIFIDCAIKKFSLPIVPSKSGAVCPSHVREHIGNVMGNGE
jgi:hypothetical protein